MGPMEGGYRRMNKEVMKSIARVTAVEVAREYGKDVSQETVIEWVENELPGLEDDFFTDVVELAMTFLKVVAVHVEIQDWLIDKDGNIREDRPEAW